MPNVGDRVKFSDAAIVAGVSKDRKKRGTILREARDKTLWVVQWDDKKTVDRLHKSYVVKATTGQRFST